MIIDIMNRDFLKRSWFPILIILLLLSAVGIISQSKLSIPHQISLIDLIGVYGSLFLSAILVYFYSEVRRVQKQQAQIQENQTHLMRLEHEPRLVPEDWNALGNHVSFELTNIGGGFAQNIALEVIVRPINSDVTRLISDRLSLEESYEREKENRNRTGNRTLGPEEVSRPFNCTEVTIGLSKVTEEGVITRSRRSFSDQITTIRDEYGIERALFQILLSYEDSTGKEHRTVVTTRDILLKNISHFEDVLHDVGIPNDEAGPLDEPRPFSIGDRNLSFDEMKFVPRDD